MNSQSKASSERSKVLDALRAIAILLVLGRHTSVSDFWTHVGWCGVDLFFVLSGFLISGLLFQEYKRFGNIRLGRFWLRRGLKIYPAFYLYILALPAMYLVMFRQMPGAARFPVRPLLTDATFLSSYFSGLSGHTWSLAVEEHFYLLLPLFLLLLIRLRPNREDPFTSIPLVFLGIATGALLLRMAATPSSLKDYCSYLFPTHLRMDALFCGVMLGYFFHFKPQFLSRVAGWPLLLAGVALLSPIYFFEIENWQMYTWGLTCTYLGFACILVFAIHTPFQRAHLAALPINLLAHIGFYSYSIYLWHWLVIYWLRPYIRYLCITTGSPFQWSRAWETWQWPLCVAFSVLAGIAMAVVVEQPVLRLRDRWFPSRTQPIALTDANHATSVQASEEDHVLKSSPLCAVTEAAEVGMPQGN